MLALWKRLVSEVETGEKMSKLLNVDNVGAERTCSGRLLQATDWNSHAKCPVAEL